MSQPPYKKTELADAFAHMNANAMTGEALDTSEAAVIDAEIGAYRLFRKIAAFYTTGTGERETQVQTYLSSDEKWGPYYICLLPYEENEAVTNEDEETVGRSDSVLRDRLTRLGDHLEIAAKDHVAVDRPDDMLMLTFPTIEDMISATRHMLQFPQTRGNQYEKSILLARLPLLEAQLRLEKPPAVAVAPEANAAPEPPKPIDYGTFMTHYSSALVTILNHVAYEDEVDVTDLRMDWLVTSNGFEMVYDMTYKDGDKKGRVDPLLNAFMHGVFGVIDEENGMGDCVGGGSAGRYAVKVPTGRDAILLLRSMLDHLAAEPMYCIDDMVGLPAIVADPETLSEATKNVFPHPHLLAFLPDGIQLSPTQAAMQQHVYFENGVFPFSMRQLEYHLLQAQGGGKSYVPNDLAAFRLH